MKSSLMEHLRSNGKNVSKLENDMRDAIGEVNWFFFEKRFKMFTKGRLCRKLGVTMPNCFESKRLISAVGNSTTSHPGLVEQLRCVARPVLRALSDGFRARFRGERVSVGGEHVTQSLEPNASWKWRPLSRRVEKCIPDDGAVYFLPPGGVGEPHLLTAAANWLQPIRGALLQAVSLVWPITFVGANLIRISE